MSLYSECSACNSQGGVYLPAVSDNWQPCKLCGEMGYTVSEQGKEILALIARAFQLNTECAKCEKPCRDCDCKYRNAKTSQLGKEILKMCRDNLFATREGDLIKK